MANQFVSLDALWQRSKASIEAEQAVRRRREAEHETATERILEWCHRNARLLGNVSPRLGRELEELLERYRATLPDGES